MPSSFLELVSLICYSVNNPPFFSSVPSFPYLGHPHPHLSPSFDTQRELEGGVAGAPWVWGLYLDGVPPLALSLAGGPGSLPGRVYILL